MVALVDDVDFPQVSKFTWQYNRQKGYAQRQKVKDGRITSVSMHTEIMGTPKGMVTDHINRNKLDNRRSNLRICTHAQNMANQGAQKNNKSGYRGVHWHTKRLKWKAQIQLMGKTICIGFFDNKEDAALAFNQKAEELHGEFAYLNKLQETS